jgi:hypothetical protein
MPTIGVLGRQLISFDGTLPAGSGERMIQLGITEISNNSRNQSVSLVLLSS